MKFFSFSLSWILVAACTTYGCGDSNGGNLSLSFAVPISSGNTGALTASNVNVTPGLDGLTLTDGAGNTLLITSAEVVLREIEFERQENLADCDASLDNDHCEEFEVGPLLVSLPLDGSTAKEIATTVPADIYDEIEFDIHKVSSGDFNGDEDDRLEAEFATAHPDFVESSIRVQGTYNGSAFVYTSDLDEEQEIELDPPLVVAEGQASTNVTLSLNLAAWFVDGNGNLVDPESANKDGENKSRVEDNIKNSIEGFEDEDEDGEEDDEENGGS